MSCLAAANHVLFKFSVRCLKAQCWVRCCSFCTRQILRTLWTSTVYFYMRLLTTLFVHCHRENLQSAAAQLELYISKVDQLDGRPSPQNTKKTELICTRSKTSLLRQGRCLPALQLGHDSITTSDHVRLLGATISSDLSLDRHVANVSSTGFYWLRQLRRVRRSLDMVSATTLVHAFVSSRVDYCNILLASAPKVITDRLQRVLDAAARVVSSTHMYGRGFSRLLHSELHLLDVPQRVQYELGVTMYSCLHSQSSRGNP